MPGVISGVIQMRHARDPRDLLLDELKPFLDRTNIRPFGHDVLIAVYSRAGQETKGGIKLPDNYREDEFQGITGLILAMGPMASDASPSFVDWFGGSPPRIGEWIGFNVRDGISFKVGNNTCRLIEWKYLRFSCAAPDAAM